MLAQSSNFEVRSWNLKLRFEVWRGKKKDLGWLAQGEGEEGGRTFFLTRTALMKIPSKETDKNTHPYSRGP